MIKYKYLLFGAVSGVIAGYLAFFATYAIELGVIFWGWAVLSRFYQLVTGSQDVIPLSNFINNPAASILLFGVIPGIMAAIVVFYCIAGSYRSIKHIELLDPGLLPAEEKKINRYLVVGTILIVVAMTYYIMDKNRIARNISQDKTARQAVERAAGQRQILNNVVIMQGPTDLTLDVTTSGLAGGRYKAVIDIGDSSRVSYYMDNREISLMPGANTITFTIPVKNLVIGYRKSALNDYQGPSGLSGFVDVNVTLSSQELKSSIDALGYGVSGEDGGIIDSVEKKEYRLPITLTTTPGQEQITSIGELSEK